MANPFLGTWRIVEMEQWDPDYIDLVVPGFITFTRDRLGEFQFGTVQGCLDYRIEKRGERPRAEFSWEGASELDSACGRGWAEVEEAELRGRLYIHRGDDSWFKASKQTPVRKSPRARRRE